MYEEPLIGMLLALPLPAVPAVELPAPGWLVAPVAPVVEPGLLELVGEPMRAFVSMYCAPPIREALAPVLPLVPVAPAVPLALPPCRHPVTVIVRLLADV